MSTIRDRAVRALQPIFREHGHTGPLAYCCDGPCGDPIRCGGCPPPCPHRTCAAVRVLDGAGLLGYTTSQEATG